MKVLHIIIHLPPYVLNEKQIMLKALFSKIKYTPRYIFPYVCLSTVFLNAFYFEAEKRTLYLSKQLQQNICMYMYLPPSSSKLKCEKDSSDICSQKRNKINHINIIIILINLIIQYSDRSFIWLITCLGSHVNFHRLSCGGKN